MRLSETALRGRGTAAQPTGRFESIERTVDPERLHPDDVGPKTEILRDQSRVILSRNDSPDIPFSVSLNPYRGCEHGCIYCYARPTHEFLGFSAGLDFESKIVAKPDAPALLRRELSKPGWTPDGVVMSGVTDCYQPVERELRITRGCLEVFLDFRNPVGIITKSALLARDLDLLAELASFGLVHVAVSLTTLSDEIAYVMEPRAARPQRRLDLIGQLSSAGVPVHVMCAPVIPGLTDHELPELLREAASRGARSANYVALRLPYGLADLFETWLQDHFPDHAHKVLRRIESIRGGKRNDPRFGARMRGEGPIAEEVESLFRIAKSRAGFQGDPSFTTTVRHFRVPGKRQATLF